MVVVKMDIRPINEAENRLQIESEERLNRLPEWKREIILRKRVVASKSHSKSAETTPILTAPRKVKGQAPMPPRVYQNGLLPSPAANIQSDETGSTCSDPSATYPQSNRSSHTSLGSYGHIENAGNANHVVKASHSNRNDLAEINCDQHDETVTNIDCLINDELPLARNTDNTTVQSASANGDELPYEPGFVQKLQLRFQSLSLKKLLPKYREGSYSVISDPVARLSTAPGGATNVSRAASAEQLDQVKVKRRQRAVEVRPERARYSVNLDTRRRLDPPPNLEFARDDIEIIESSTTSVPAMRSAPPPPIAASSRPISNGDICHIERPSQDSPKHSTDLPPPNTVSKIKTIFESPVKSTYNEDRSIIREAAPVAPTRRKKATLSPRLPNNSESLDRAVLPDTSSQMQSLHLSPIAINVAPTSPPLVSPNFKPWTQRNGSDHIVNESPSLTFSPESYALDNRLHAAFSFAPESASIYDPSAAASPGLSPRAPRGSVATAGNRVILRSHDDRRAVSPRALVTESQSEPVTAVDDLTSQYSPNRVLFTSIASSTTKSSLSAHSGESRTEHSPLSKSSARLPSSRHATPSTTTTNSAATQATKHPRPPTSLGLSATQRKSTPPAVQTPHPAPPERNVITTREAELDLLALDILRTRNELPVIERLEESLVSEPIFQKIETKSERLKEGALMHHNGPVGDDGGVSLIEGYADELHVVVVGGDVVERSILRTPSAPSRTAGLALTFDSDVVTHEYQSEESALREADLRLSSALDALPHAATPALAAALSPNVELGVARFRSADEDIPPPLAARPDASITHVHDDGLDDFVTAWSEASNSDLLF